MKIGVIKEGKIPVDHRVPFTPEQCVIISKKFGVEVKVQSSNIRAFKDEEYASLGIEVVEDLSDCDVLFGVKEVPKESLLDGKIYFFFSHTIKKQAYNRDLLRLIIDKKIQLIDYEVLKGVDGQRVVAFGRFAGIVGAYNGLLTYGKKFNLFQLKAAHLCYDMDELWSELKKVNLEGVKILLTGGGRVANGAIEVLKSAGIMKVSEEIYLNSGSTAFLQLESDKYNQRKDGSKFELNEFYSRPELFESTFDRFLNSTDLLIAGAYWDPHAPVLFNNTDVKQPDFRIKVIADITCDIQGSIPTTLRSTTIADPVFDFNKESLVEEKGFSSEDHLTVMAVDNLPCELPRDASDSFGSQLLENVIPDFITKDGARIIEEASITKDGELTTYFSYLQDYID